MKEIKIRAYAKLNLSLEVLARLPSGYHAVRTVLQAVDLFDTLTITVKMPPRGRAAGVRPRVSLNARFAPALDAGDFPFDERNLAVRAAMIFIDYITPNFNAGIGDIDIRIEKRIPASAGLGGGSADAAATLLGLARLLAPGAVAQTELMTLGARIGADVPFCVMSQCALNPELGFADSPLAATCALGEGVGDRLLPLPPLDAWVRIVKPPARASTARVYGLLDPASLPAGPDTDAFVAGLRAGDCDEIVKNMGNALEIAALEAYPEIASEKARMIADSRADRVLMSGSGSAVFALYREDGFGRASAAETRGSDAFSFVGRLLCAAPDAS